MEENKGDVKQNVAQGKVNTNSGTVEENLGTVKNNNSTVETNSGTVKTNNETVEKNTAAGTVEKNFGEVEENAGIVEMNAINGTVTDIENGTVYANYGTEIKADGTVFYGTVVNNAKGSRSSKLAQFQQGVSTDLKKMFKRKGYSLKGYMVAEGVAGGVDEDPERGNKATMYKAEAPGAITLVWQKQKNRNKVITVTYIKGSLKDTPTTLKAQSEAKLELDGNVLSVEGVHTVEEGMLLLRADYLETLDVGEYQLIVTIGSTATRIKLIVK